MEKTERNYSSNLRKVTILLIILISGIFSGKLYGQDFSGLKFENPPPKKWDCFFTLGPMVYINTDKNTAPSPIVCGTGFGMNFFKNFPVQMQSKITFFTNYYCWDGTFPRPAKIENRTSLVLSMLCDLDACYSWNFGNIKLEAGCGLSFLVRYATLAQGVNKGNLPPSLTTAEEDTSHMNKAFYSGLNFLYPNITISCIPFRGNFFCGGFEGRFYIPLQALIDKRLFDTMIISLAFKFLIGQ